MTLFVENVELSHAESRGGDRFVIDWEYMQDSLILRFTSKEDGEDRAFAEWDTQDGNASDVVTDLNAIIDALQRLKQRVSGDTTE